MSNERIFVRWIVFQALGEIKEYLRVEMFIVLEQWMDICEVNCLSSLGLFPKPNITVTFRKKDQRLNIPYFAVISTAWCFRFWNTCWAVRIQGMAGRSRSFKTNGRIFAIWNVFQAFGEMKWYMRGELFIILEVMKGYLRGELFAKFWLKWKDTWELNCFSN